MIIYNHDSNAILARPLKTKSGNELLQNIQEIHHYLNTLLVIDDLGVKYIGKKTAKHLSDMLQQQYEISEDWTGKNYLGLEIDWSYESKPRYVTILMPKYVPSALTKLQHSPSLKLQHSPAPHIIPTYEAKLQYAPIEEEHLHQLSDEKKKYIQQVIGTFLYYACALDSTILVALSNLGSE